MSVGVLNQDQIHDLIENRHIKSTDPIELDPQKDIDPSGIDLPLGTRYWRMSASCRPGVGIHVKDLISEFKETEEKPLKKETILSRGNTYLVEIPWTLALPKGVFARATAKSSIGRLDTLVRLIADEEAEFETITSHEQRNLFVEIRPNTFDLCVGPSDSLSQIRFIRGEEHHCTVSAEALSFEEDPPLVDAMGNRTAGTRAAGDQDATLLRLDLSPDPVLNLIGFVAKKEYPEPIDPSMRDRYDPTDYWEPIEKPTKRRPSLKIERDRFYILRSKDRFRLPSHLAVDCKAVTESLGDIRIHYAGFAHPFFGWNRSEGAPLIFEVRGYHFNTILHDETALAKVYFRRMSVPANKPDDPSYSDQELKLSKCFKDWPQ